MVTNWLAELDGRRVTVEVPATSANLGAGYDCLGVALGLTNRVEVEVRGWSRGEIDLTVDGEGVGELPADRTNRCVLGIEAALREVRGEMPDGRRLADRDAQRDPAGPRPGLVGRGDGRRARRRQRAPRRAADAGATCCASRRGSRAIPTTPRRRSSAGSPPVPSSATRSRRSGSTRRATSARSCSSRSSASRRTRCARRCPAQVPLRGRRREPDAGSRSASPAWRPAGSTCSGS